MELAGLSVATAAVDFLSSSPQAPQPQSTGANKNILVLSGPGNNGGDGLVAARHLKHFGYSPRVLYPKRNKGVLFANLVAQCRALDIPVVSDMSELAVEEANVDSDDVFHLSADTGAGTDGRYVLIIDAFFGFSFKGPAVREPFASIIAATTCSALLTTTPVLSVDIPSGWDVERGDVYGTGLVPAAVVSLTLPKQCMAGYAGSHYVGGRFMPHALAKGLGLAMSDYGQGAAQVVKLTSLGGEGSEGCGDAGTAAVLEPLSAVYVTAPSMEVAKALSNLLLAERAAACVNILPKVVSMYEWEGQVEEEEEVLLMIKTRTSLVDRLTALVKGAHPYDVPEVVAVPLDMMHGNVDYLQWVKDSTGAAASPAPTPAADATTTATVEGTTKQH